MLQRFIPYNHIFLNPSVESKQDLLSLLSRKAEELKYVSSAETFLDAVMQKESQTIIELKPHIIMPHGRGDFVNELFVFLVVSQKGIVYPTAKSNRAHIIFFIGVPSKNQHYLKLVASVSRAVSKEDFIKSLEKAEITDDILYAIKNVSVESKYAKPATDTQKYLVALILNKPVIQTDIVSSFFTESGVGMIYEIDVKNIGNGLTSIPFLSAFGLSKGKSLYGKLFLGITDSADAAAHVASLLESENIQIHHNGTGTIIQFPLAVAFGGLPEDLL